MNTKEVEIKIKKFGTKDEVFNGLATKTRGGLVKDDLELSAKGKVSSKKRIALGKKLYEKRMEKMKTEPKIHATM
jgi:hypothetical protein